MAKLGDPYQYLVAAIVQLMEPNVQVDIGTWIEGPDGERDLDVSIRGNLQNSPAFVLIECKDWKRRVGIQAIDALDSKRKDLGVTLAVICSNSGFSKNAIKKAKRVGILPVAAAKQGDARVRITIEDEVYCGRVKINKVQCTYFGSNLGGLPNNITDRDVLYEGRPMAAWIRSRVGWYINQFPQDSRLRARIQFRSPVIFSFGGTSRAVTGLQLEVEYEIKWYSRFTSIDASAGLYNYLTGYMNIEPTGQYHISNINCNEENWDTQWKQINFVPESVLHAARLFAGEPDTNSELPIGMEVRVWTYVLEGIDIVDNVEPPQFDALVENETVDRM